MTQVQTLISMMRKGWVSTADAFNAGISSYHRRLADLRAAHEACYLGQDLQYCYNIAGKKYRMMQRERNIETRWGKAKIKEYRLTAVK